MTFGTRVLGLTSLCFGTTQLGGEGPPYVPMARATVGGLLFSTVVSLVFLPSIYVALDRLRLVLGRMLRWIVRKGSTRRRRAPACGRDKSSNCAR